MSAVAQDSSAGGQVLELGEDPRGSRWMIFAATLLLVLGCTNIIEGVAAVDGSHSFAGGAHYIFGDLNSWGWVLWMVGIAQGLTAVAILIRNQLARWLGVAFALINLFGQMLMIEAYPLWSLVLIGLDVLVIYGLVVHGARRYQST